MKINLSHVRLEIYVSDDHHNDEDQSIPVNVVH